MYSRVKCKRCGEWINLSKHDFKSGNYKDICPKCLSKPPKMGEVKVEKKEKKSDKESKPFGEVKSGQDQV